MVYRSQKTFLCTIFLEYILTVSRKRKTKIWYLCWVLQQQKLGKNNKVIDQIMQIAKKNSQIKTKHTGRSLYKT